MKILCIDQGSNCLDWALRCMAEQHDVRVFQSPDSDGSKSKVGNGLIVKVPTWEPSMRWADLIFTADNLKYITALESWRMRGFPIFGPRSEERHVCQKSGLHHE